MHPGPYFGETASARREVVSSCPERRRVGIPSAILYYGGEHQTVNCMEGVVEFCPISHKCDKWFEMMWLVHRRQSFLYSTPPGVSCAK
jgi:hypothetical protein